jgi:hypothetical protein
MGGKEALIKAISQAIPVFAMTVFNIPKKICKGITDAISQFWWGDDDDHKKNALGSLVEDVFTKR